MDNTGKVSDQLKKIVNGFDNSNHTFMTRMILGLQNRISETVKELDTTPSGKESSVGQISVTLSGSKLVNDGQLKQTSDDIRRMFDALRNPSNFIDLLGE